MELLKNHIELSIKFIKSIKYNEKILNNILNVYEGKELLDNLLDYENELLDNENKRMFIKEK